MKTLRGWIKIMRLQFYPMTFITYGLGAAIAHTQTDLFAIRPFIAGYVCLFFIELITILANEIYDYPSDKINTNASIFTGGSRAIVEGLLTVKQVKIGIKVVAGIILIAGSFLIASAGSGTAITVVVMLVIGLFLGLGYTTPPLKFSHRGLGELDVAITHSSYVILCGYVFQTGLANVSVPCLVSVPLLLATASAIILSGIPDYSADTTTGKRTLSVIFGPRTAAGLAALCTVLAVLMLFLLYRAQVLSFHMGFVLSVISLHALLQIAVILKLLQNDYYDRKINVLMGMSLTFSIWFGLFPLIDFLSRQ